MEKFEVTILGCGSALPTLRHNSSSQVVNIREKYFLIDCAEGTQVELRRQRIHLNRLNNIFISHLHGDHCFGLMGLISTQGLLGRTAPLHVFGPQDIAQIFQPQIDYFCPHLEYKVTFHPIDTKAFAPIYDDRSVTVYSIPMNHRVPCTGYLFKEKPLLPHIRPEAIARYDIPTSQINNIKAGLDFTTAEGKIIPNRELVIPADPPRSYAYCSDTMYKPEIVPLIKDINLLYHEATYGDDKEDNSRKYFHSTARQAATIARDANVGKLIIGHFSHRYEDETILLQQAQEVFPNTILAKENLMIEV